MHKSDLEHIIRAASAITNQYEIVVVGSQSILGSVESPPLECLESIEADIFVPGNACLSDLIDGAIGEGSQFHDSFGYYAQGVSEATSILPSRWQDRLIRLQSQNTDGKIGYCLDVTDLFLAKCAANREKDRDFNLALLRKRIVDPAVAASRVSSMPLDADAKKRIENTILRLTAEVHVETPSTPNQEVETAKNPDAIRMTLVAQLREQGIEIQEAKDGIEYVGKIRQITVDGLMVQSVNRTAVIVHELAHLDGDFAVGQLAEIKYQAGRGYDRLQVRQKQHRHER